MRFKSFPRRFILITSLIISIISFFLAMIYVFECHILSLIICVPMCLAAIVFEIHACINYLKNITIIDEDKIIQIVGKEKVKELRYSDVKQIILLYIPKGNNNVIIVIDDGSFDNEIDLFTSKKIFLKTNYCYFDYSKKRMSFINERLPQIYVERRSTLYSANKRR